MRSLKVSLLALGLTAAISSNASAQLSFDDATTTPFSVVSNYGGFNWSNAFVIDPIVYMGGASQAGGFLTAMQSPSWVMGNYAARPLTMSRGTAFDLTGGVFASVWKNGMTLNAVGSRNGVQLYNQNYSINWDVSRFLALNMTGVDEVTFTSSGGTDAPGFAGRNYSFAMDDITFTNSVESVTGESAVSVVPEPMTMSLVGFGLLALGGLHARRRRAVSAN
ncbi:MAG: PEP-CTERM sorting domain-containing protein [Phycisphaerae bacterium]|nr:PEP-CTERM sorting domain-containing protein [Gemmatimonadaceae bacterium]